MQNWYENAIIYHIYPIGFCGAPRENPGGAVEYRLDRVLDLIPHLQEMNVSAIYFSPLFESVSHGYDTTDYKHIDRRLGDNASFKRICDTLHENGIRVILDGVFNHVGRNFPQFCDIQAHGEASPYCGWFENLNFGGSSPCGDRFWYEGWNGHYNLVKLNLRNPAVCDYLLDAVAFWLDEFGIDGIRFDAADCIDFDFFRRIRRFCKERRPDFWLMGEIIHGDYTRWANSEMLDSVTNYECYKGIYSSHNDKNYFEIDYSINRQFGNSGIYKGIALYNFVDNHDVNRIASTVRNPADLQNIYTLLYTMPGIPSIYYGSEFGIRGVKENHSDDNLRPCLDYPALRAENQSIYQHIIRLGRIYQAYPALRTGAYHTMQIRNEQVLFQKELNGQVVYVALNLSDTPFDMQFGTHLPALVDVLSSVPVSLCDGNVNLQLPPHTGVILVADDIVNETPKLDATPTPQPREVVIGGVYRHKKGREYTVLAVARHSETLEEMVVYQARYGEQDVWVRPKDMFLEITGGVARFTLLAPTE